MLSANDLGLVTVEEAAELAGVSVATIRKWVYRYGITRVEHEGRVLLSERDVLNAEVRTRRERRGRRRVA